MKELYGYALEEIRSAVSDILDEPHISLDASLLDGWSSINLLCYRNDIPAYIIKLPKSLEEEKLGYLFEIHDELSKHDICSRPIHFGSPFEDGPGILILEYIEGTIYNSPYDISDQHMSELKHLLDCLAAIDLNDIPHYTSAKKHLEGISSTTLSNVQNYGLDLVTSYSEVLRDYVHIVSEAKRRISSSKWESVTVHGDLYERNIVFHDGKATLLDMEECCKSNRFYDYVYLYSQSYSDQAPSQKHRANSFSCSEDMWVTLEIVTLCSVITWSIQRLLDFELGLIEPSLSRKVPEDLVLEYVKEKIGSLHAIILE